jgi:predicted nucleic acid-binding Zn finger protein
MSLDDAIQQMNDRSKAASPCAHIRAIKISEEEARLSVYATAEDMQTIRMRRP